MTPRPGIVLRLEHPHGRLVAVRPMTAEVIDDETRARLLPEENALLATLLPRRRESWLAGRLALIEALALLGAERVPILPDDRGAPTVAPGISGSISHKPELAVALADRSTGAAIGVDVETLARPRPAIASRILTDREQAAVDALPEAERWIAVLARFAIKEAIYKAVDPFVRRYVAFREAEIEGLEVGAPSPLEQPVVQPVEARLVLAQGEGPFEVEATWAHSEVLIATARVRRR